MMAGIFTHHAHSKQFRNSCYFEIVNIYAMILAIRTGIDFHEFHAAGFIDEIFRQSIFILSVLFLKRNALK